MRRRKGEKTGFRNQKKKNHLPISNRNHEVRIVSQYSLVVNLVEIVAEDVHDLAWDGGLHDELERLSATALQLERGGAS
jgi:hypothetical protein